MARRRPSPASFLLKLRELLTQEDPAVISWDDEGRITINDPGQLSSDVLIRYFRHNNFSSFQRQLNYFGYYKISGKGKLERCVYTNDGLGDGGLDAPPYEVDALLRLKRKSTRDGGAGTGRSRSVSRDLDEEEEQLQREQQREQAEGHHGGSHTTPQRHQMSQRQPKRAKTAHDDDEYIQIRDDEPSHAQRRRGTRRTEAIEAAAQQQRTAAALAALEQQLAREAQQQPAAEHRDTSDDAVDQQASTSSSSQQSFASRNTPHPPEEVPERVSFEPPPPPPRASSFYNSSPRGPHEQLLRRPSLRWLPSFDDLLGAQLAAVNSVDSLECDVSPRSTRMQRSASPLSDDLLLPTSLSRGVSYDHDFHVRVADVSSRFKANADGIDLVGRATPPPPQPPVFAPAPPRPDSPLAHARSVSDGSWSAPNSFLSTFPWPSHHAGGAGSVLPPMWATHVD